MIVNREVFPKAELEHQRPMFFWAAGPTGEQFTNFVTSSYAIPEFGFTPLGTTQVKPVCDNVMAPIDVRKLLGNGRRFMEAREVYQVGGPVDVRSLVGVNGEFSTDFAKKTKKENTEKSLSGLPPKLVEQGVSKRLVKLENLKRKKRYVRDLEERSRAMSKHLEALEKQNSQLRALLSLGCKGVDLPPPLPRFKHAPFTDKPRVYQRRNIGIDTRRSVISTMEKLYLSTLYV